VVRDSTYTPGGDSSVFDSDEEEVKRPSRKQKK
jgi:hypothetical protein